jgi:Ras-related protein Rab-23
MLEEDIDVTLKVIVVGNGQVGKTSMITRFSKGIFTNEYKKTLAVDFLEKRSLLPSSGEEITYLLWDTAGQEEYDAITRGYYKGAGACVIAFSTVDRASFDALDNWSRKVRDECGDIPTLLVQNKVDLIDQAVMTPQEVEATASKLGLTLYRMCVKENLNVSDVFLHLGEEFLRRGGEAGMGISSVTSMTKHATTASGAKPAAADPSSAKVPLEATPAGNNGAAAKPFKVGEKRPSVQRTGGKKRLFTQCAIL